MIEKMLNCYKKLGRNNPVSFGNKRNDWKINGKIISSHYGAGTIVKYRFFNNKINEIYKYTTIDRIKKGIKCADDVLYTFSALLNGYKYLRCKEYSISPFVDNSPKLNKPFSENYRKKIIFLIKDYKKVIQKYIIKKYNTTIKELIEKAENRKN